MTLLHTLIEMMTGLSTQYRADIGPELYLGHFGRTIVHAEAIHADAKLGTRCNLSQGMTIGISGRGERRGVPVLGQGVIVGAHAVICGRIIVGDDVAVAATLSGRDFEAQATVMGSPAEVVDRPGCTGMGPHQRPVSRPASPS
jgi:serine O-acetyltransferase